MSSLKSKQKDFDKNLDQNYQNAKKALRILEDAGYEARLAGGCVRDRLLGIRPKDYDIATNAKPEQICIIFKQKNVKTVPTGIEHGTITVVMSGQGLEVTSLRRDVATDGRRAVVEFGESFEEDSLRRDFTINALYEDKDGKVYDYHEGLKDLSSGILRFVGNAETRIREDYLRILRLFRFWARFGYAPAEGTLEAIQKEARGLAKISAERITSELLLTLETDRFPEVLPAMIQSAVLEHIFGADFVLGDFQVYDSAVKIDRKAERALVRLAFLLWDCANKSERDARLQRLRLSNQQKALLLALWEEVLPSEPSDPASVFEWLDKIEVRLNDYAWNDVLFPVWKVRRPDMALETIEKTRLQNSKRRQVTLDGQWLMNELQLKQGPELGGLLTELKRAYRRGLWSTQDEALEFARGLAGKV